MKRYRRSPPRLIRLSGVCVSLALVFSLVSFTFPVAGSRNHAVTREQGNERQVAALPPRTGPPAGNLPNLDTLRNAAESSLNNLQQLEAPRPIPSTLRSRRKRVMPQGIGLPGSILSSALGASYNYANTAKRIGTAQLVNSTRQGFRSHHARRNATSKAANNALAPTLLQENARVNFALAANGGVATASSEYPGGWGANTTNNGERKGDSAGGSWNDNAPANTFRDWLQIDFNGAKTIDEIDVFTVQDNWQYPSEPTEAMTFSLYGLTGFDVQYWDADTSGWETVPGGDFTGNNKVWQKITFSPITTTKIRVWTSAAPDGYSRLTELEAWGPAPPRLNVALAANGGVASASSAYTPGNWGANTTNNGDRKGDSAGGSWNDAAPANSFPDWLQVDFNGLKTIDEIDVFTVQDNWQNPVEPTEAMTFSLYGLTGFDVEYWNGGGWSTVPGGNVSNNNKVWRKITFSPILTTRIRVLTNASADGYSRITEVEAWDAPATASGSSASDFAMARLDPKNRTGTGGEDLLSNNFNWNLPLVSLPGRGGLDLGLTLSYNSLVWTRSGNSLLFDADAGSIAPGFRLGFPTIEGPYWNNQANANFYLLVTPAGARVELRQIGNSIYYESADSSHLQLKYNVSIDGTLMLQPTDGSQMKFIVSGGGWRCNEIKDRNGNFITVTYKPWGEIDTITDTLGRVLTFNYDANDNLQSITQIWNGQTHEWATFGWGPIPIGDNFPGLTNFGPNSTSIPMLTQVGFPDGSRYNFVYNTYGQVSTIRHLAADPGNPNHERNHTTYVYSGGAMDCPRVAEREDAAEYWTGLNNVPDEVVTQYGHDPDGACRMTAPDGTIYKEYYGGSAAFQAAPPWQKGLVLQSEVWSDGVWQKWTAMTWTQDNTSVSYLTNPRVTETNVYDASGNHRRTTIDYGDASLGYVQWGLPYIVKEYGVVGTTATELRRTQTDYNLNQNYLDRRIIGLVSTQQLYDSVLNQWLAKTTYGYDDPAKITSDANTAVQHDQTYNASWTVLGSVTRGNVTSVSRWDVTNTNNSLTSTMTYNAAGSALTTRDAAGHTTIIEYADSFSDNGNHNTFAYPTVIKDPDWNASTAPNNRSLVQYNYDFGAKTRIEGPPPAGQQQGRIQTMLYDDALRLLRVTTDNNGAYTRYEYGPYWVHSFSTVNTIADEAYNITTFDGAGRAFTTTSNHPGSVGGYTLVNVIFDRMGRPFLQSNPTEVDNSWSPAGDDAYNPVTGEGGVRYTQQSFDWKGRPRVTTNTDGTYKDASYTGCGCAGGEVVTLTDEMNRQQKVYSDVLGRTWKTEVLTWPDANGNRSVYSATVSVFNARDQVTLVRQWAGAENGGGAYQDTTMSYDGYGRLQSKQVPEQRDQNGNPAYTIWAYNNDDTILSVTDARGASATYSYNNRHLVTHISYEPAGGVPDTTDASFGYDAAGNRISMTDGMGSASYSYNQLSQMTSETRNFAGLGNFTLNYGYNLAAELSSITDPFNATINYAYDSAARLSSVTGSSFGGVTTYAFNPQYRAWGALKSLSYGNSKTLSVEYNNGLLPTIYEVPGVLKKSYQRNNDGSVSFTQDQLTTDSKFDRSYTYDNVGRVTTALTGQEARGGAATDDRPYNDELTYDAMNHMTALTRLHWDRADGFGPQTLVNNRVSGWIYDADGRLTSGSTGYFTYDAAGRAITFGDNDPYKTDQVFDGDGRRVKTIEQRFDEQTEQFVTEKVTYYVSSSVLAGALISEVDAQGAKQRTLVYAGGSELASQTVSGGIQSVQWQYRDASGASYRATDASGQWLDAREMDPLGANAGLFKPLTWNLPDKEGLSVPYPEIADMALNPGGGCVADWVPIPCEMLNQDNSVQCPDNHCRRYNPNLRQGRGASKIFMLRTMDARAIFRKTPYIWGMGITVLPLLDQGRMSLRVSSLSGSIVPPVCRRILRTIG